MYVCEYCNKSYNTKSNLKRHGDCRSYVKICGQTRDEQKYKAIMSDCEYCNKSFSREDNLDHQGDCSSYVKVCGQCQGIQISERALHRHRRKNHQQGLKHKTNFACFLYKRPYKHI